MAGAESGQLSVEGAVLEYQVDGAGSPVVLLHGAGRDRSLWDAQVAPLSFAHAVVRYSARGSDDTTGTSGETHAEDLKALLEHLALTRVALLSISIGARIAVAFAAAYPDWVRALVLVDPAVDGVTTEQLAAVAAPTLVAVGALAPADSQETASTLEAAIADAWKVVVPGAGRRASQDAPQRFNEVVLAFLAETERKSRR